MARTSSRVGGTRIRSKVWTVSRHCMALVGSRLCASLIRITNRLRGIIAGGGWRWLRSRTGMLFARSSPVALEIMQTAHAHAPKAT
jgi:hypothetical protein